RLSRPAARAAAPRWSPPRWSARCAACSPSTTASCSAGTAAPTTSTSWSSGPPPTRPTWPTRTRPPDVREICLVHLDKTRPALVLTREAARAAMTKVTVAPVTTTVKGLTSEVLVGPRNGLDHECVISLDNILTVPKGLLGRTIGFLTVEQ